MKLYDLSINYANILDLIDNEEYTEEQLKDTLDSMNELIQEKAENIIKLIKSIEGEAEIIKAEKDKLAQKQKARENKATWLKQYLSDSLRVAQIDKVKTNLFSIWMQEPPMSVEVVDESKIPYKFKTPQPDKISKADIKKAIDSGEVVEGAKLIKGEKTVRYR